MKYFLCTLFVIGILLKGSNSLGQKTRVQELNYILEQKTELVLVAAHRGAHRDVPENSLASIDNAVAAGAAIVELDVRQTKDGVFILMHDKSLDRTTTGKGLVEDHTWAELQHLYLLHEGKATAHKIPTFKEALEHLRGKILIDVDFKVSGLPAREEAYKLIENLGVEDHVIFFLYDFKEMEHLYRINPKIKLMPRAYTYDMLDEIVALGITKIIHLDESFTDQEKLSNLKGLRLWANTLGKVDQAAKDDVDVFGIFRKKHNYINIIQTDLPETLYQFLKK